MKTKIYNYTTKEGKQYTITVTPFWNRNDCFVIIRRSEKHSNKWVEENVFSLEMLMVRIKNKWCLPTLADVFAEYMRQTLLCSLDFINYQKKRKKKK